MMTIVHHITVGHTKR